MKKISEREIGELRQRRAAPLLTSTDLTPDATRDISAALNVVLADCSRRI